MKADKQNAVPPPPQQLALRDKADKQKPNGKGKGKDKGGGSGIPRGIKSKDASGNGVCFAYSKKEKCVQEPCTFSHVCWWCLGEHPGNDCPNRR